MSYKYVSQQPFDMEDHAFAPSIRSVLMSLSARTTQLGFDLRSRLRGRQTARQLARFPDHRLQDIGFERDWDGSIIPLKRDSRPEGPRT